LNMFHSSTMLCYFQTFFFFFLDSFCVRSFKFINLFFSFFSIINSISLFSSYALLLYLKNTVWDF
jgi:hypothetical protein